MTGYRERIVLAGLALGLFFGIAPGRGEEMKTEITFKKASDLEYFKNLTPGIIDFRREGLFSAEIGSLTNEQNRDGFLLFDEGKHQGSSPALCGNGTYSLDFVVRPTGGYFFGVMLGPDVTNDSFVYSRQPSRVLCYAFYSGGGYVFLLSVDGTKKESKALGSWVWETRWYRLTLVVEESKDVTGTITDLSTNTVVDALKISAPAPLAFLPARLYLVTETCSKMNSFLRLGKFAVVR